MSSEQIKYSFFNPPQTQMENF